MASQCMVLYDYLAGATAAGPLGGPVAPTPAGWEHRLLVIVQDPSTGQRDTLSGCVAETLVGDTAPQIQSKVLAAVKAYVIAHGYSAPTGALVENFSIVTGF